MDEPRIKPKNLTKICLKYHEDTRLNLALECVVCLCVCMCECVCVYVCVILSQSTSKKTHMSDLSKLDALLHKRHYEGPSGTKARHM